MSFSGVRIAIDDFRTGDSSLGSLKRFPIHTLKLEKSLLRNITTNPEEAAVTAAIIAAAHALDLKVIALGVETDEQLALLRSQQCDEIQGYLFRRAAPAEAFTKLLQEGHRLSPGGTGVPSAPFAP
jgi:EAL domain-containing protein (putative c-di-GMP-specific phosphodiesterase class I)